MKQATLNIGRTILAWLSYTMTKSVPASQSLFPLAAIEIVIQKQMLMLHL